MTRRLPALHVMTAMLFLALFLVAPSLAFAQTPATATGVAAPGGETAVQSLLQVQGKRAWITTVDGKREKAYVVTVAPSGVTVAVTARTTREIAFAEILKVQTTASSSGGASRLVRGGLIGFGSGFGGMALLLATCWDDECEPSLAPAVGFGALGAGIGVGIGALMNLHDRPSDVIYSKPRSTTTFNVAPILSPTRKGAAVSLTWR
jgi:hypothetical protein